MNMVSHQVLHGYTLCFCSQIDIEMPILPEDVDKLVSISFTNVLYSINYYAFSPQFSYSFSLEREVRNNQVPKKIDHFTHGYWTVNYPSKPSEE